MATAKIQYTIKIEDVPLETARHVIKAAEKMQDLIDRLGKISRDLVTSQDTIASAKILQQIRTDLAVLDLNLDDCYNILTGYANYQASLLKPQQEQSQNDATGGN